MSANLDLVRSIFADWERGDFSDASWAHPKIEFAFVDGPEPGHWHGIEQMDAAWHDWLGGFVSFRSEAHECRELDHGRVLALTTFIGRGRASGVDLGQMTTEQAATFQIREGKVTRLGLYWDRNRALGDLGLAPEAG